MSSSLLALLNFVLFLLLLCPLAQAIARAHWTGRGSGAAILLLTMLGQVWIIPQLVGYFAFAETRLLCALWFGNWITLTAAAALLSFALRGSSARLLEAARMDGSGARAVFSQVVWPNVRPAFGILAILLLMATAAEMVRPLFPEAWRWPNHPLPDSPSAFGSIFVFSLIATLLPLAVFFLARGGRNAGR